MKYIKDGQVIEVANPDLNPDLIKGLTQVPDTTTLGISSATLTPQPNIDVPTTPVDTTDYKGLLTGGQVTIDSLLKALTPPDTINPAKNDLETRLKALTTQMGIEPKEQDVLAKQGSLQTAKGKMAAINAELAGLKAEQEAIPIRLQKEAEGRGITAGGLAPIQTGELRNLALRALPIQARALAAQAEVASAQGDVELSQRTLELAQNKLSTIFQLQSKDAENKYNYWKDLRDKVFDIATTAEKNKLAAQQKEDDRKFQLYTDTLNDAQAKATALLGTQPELSAKISARIGQSTGINDTKLAGDIAALMAQAKPTKTSTGDVGEFKQFFPNVDITTPQGRQQFLNWKSQVGAAGRAPTETTAGTYVPGSNPTVDNWAKLIIAGQAKITEVPNPRGSTLRSDVINAINSSGQLLLSDKDREKLSTLDTAFNVYETIKGLSDKINTFGVGGRVTGALSRYLGGATQYNTDIARYNAARQGFVSNVARTLGEKGALAEGDVQRAINNLPTINDTKKVAEGKLETLRTILQGAKDSIVQKSTEPLTKTSSGTLGTFTVSTPDGQTFKFPDQASADAFKKKAGL